MYNKALSYKELKKMVASDGIQKVTQHLCESIENKELDGSDFSLRQLYGALLVDSNGNSMGADFIEELFDRKRRGANLFEDTFGASNLVTTSGLSQVNGQIFYNELLKGYEAEDFTVKNIIPEIATTIKDGEKIGGISELNPSNVKIPEGGTYPSLNLTENYVQTPPCYKLGGTVEVTLEEVIADKTAMVLERARKVGETIGVREELDSCAALADLNNVDGEKPHRYTWRSQPGQTPNVIATYGDSSGTHNWDNLSATTTMADYTQLNACELLLQNQVSPFTGLPMTFSGQRHLIVTQQNYVEARRLLKTIEIRNPVAVASGATKTQITEGNALWEEPVLLVSKWLNYLMSAYSNSEPTSSFYWGMPQMAFRKMVFLPLQTEEATTLNPNNWLRDVMFSYKARKIFSLTTIEPRAMVKATAS